MQDVLFFVKLCSPSIMILRCIHVVRCMQSWFLFVAGCYSIPPQLVGATHLVDIWVISSVWLLQIKLYILDKSLCRHTSLFVLGRCPGVKGLVPPVEFIFKAYSLGAFQRGDPVPHLTSSGGELWVLPSLSALGRVGPFNLTPPNGCILIFKIQTLQ